ncbi:hypothetical protein OESDEN_12516 [Oesophagostomum dentatum]|uniref:Uncharacterized protein n=1 Tax=Oesophagostomum dentatum TaxID=61180 RepID=A0A0B1SRZ1_OESDE|nr:hypothetical protein OESDEN_12516 [Oesophagostomum dentatum]
MEELKFLQELMILFINHSEAPSRGESPIKPLCEDNLKCAKRTKYGWNVEHVSINVEKPKRYSSALGSANQLNVSVLPIKASEEIKMATASNATKL